MKYAILADIHSNYQALKSVIADIKSKKVDKIICAGDIITKGVNSRKCIDLVKESCDIVLQGNVDFRHSQNPEDFKDNPLECNRIKFNQSLMTKDDIDYLLSLPLCTEFKLAEKLVRVFHAHPESNFKTINNYNTSFKEKFELFKPSQYTESQEIADIVVYGHIHYQYLEKIYHRTIINCGSVGSPGMLVFDENINCPADEIRQAHYVILEDKDNNISITFESVDYDIQKELEDNSINPEKEAYFDEILNAKYRCIDKLKKSLEDKGYKF